MILYKHTSVCLLQNKDGSWRMKQSICGCLVQDHTGGQQKTEHYSSDLPSSASCTRTALFGPMLHGSAWEELEYWWAERQSKANPVATETAFPASNCLWCFMQQRLRWGRRGRCTEVKCFISLDKIHTLFYILAFLGEHKDTETRMFALVFSNISNFPELC